MHLSNVAIRAIFIATYMQFTKIILYVHSPLAADSSPVVIAVLGIMKYGPTSCGSADVIVNLRILSLKLEKIIR